MDAERYTMLGLFISKHLQCSQCGFTTASMTYMQVHIRDHMRPSNYQCGYCAMKFTLKKAMLEHIRQVHMNREWSYEIVNNIV